MTLVTLFNCVCCFYAGQTLLIQPSCDLVVWINWFTFLFLMNQWVNLMHIIIYWLCQLGPVQTPNFSWAEPNSTYGWSKLFRPAELIEMPILIAAERRSKGAKCSFWSNCLQSMYNNLCISFGTWKVQRLNQSHSKVTPKAKFLVRLGEKNSWAVPNWNRLS